MTSGLVSSPVGDDRWCFESRPLVPVFCHKKHQAKVGYSVGIVCHGIYLVLANVLTVVVTVAGLTVNINISTAGIIVVFRLQLLCSGVPL